MDLSTETLPPDVSRASGALAVVWIEAIISGALITLRFVARRKIKAIGIDDWVMLVSVVLFFIGASLVSRIAAIGGFRHSIYLTQDQALKLAKFNWIQQPFWVANFGISKIAVALLILRLMANTATKRRVLVWVLVGMNVVFTVLGVIFIFIQCSPPEALWTPALQEPGRCWSTYAYNSWTISQSVIYITTDVVFAVVPVSLIFKLKAPLKKKATLCAVLSLGIFAAIVGAVKLPKLRELDPQSDVTWELFPLICFTITEIALVIWAGCIPTLGPLFRHGFYAKSSTYGSHKLISRDKSGYPVTTGSGIQKTTDTIVEYHTMSS